MKSDLERKTIRPGNLGDYSFYYSSRSLPQADKQPVPVIKKSKSSKRLVSVVLAVIVIGFGGWQALKPRSVEPAVRAAQTSNIGQVAAEPQKNDTASNVAPIAKQENCAGNTLPQMVKVSIGQRHMWACDKEKTLYDAPVITGMEAHDSTKTPLGTYKIYAKQANTTLTGSDESGSWKRPVHYWMPFLDNEHGTYGFHDATWRPDNEFGAIDPNSDKGSHGCVELPLQAQAWLYDWALPGTAVTIVS